MSDYINFGLADYIFQTGRIELVENNSHTLIFDWPGAEIQGFTSYHLFCLVLDKHNGTISLIIDGQYALREYKPWIQNSKLQLGEVMLTEIGFFCNLIAQKKIPVSHQ
jgi:hypothetical protein